MSFILYQAYVFVPLKKPPGIKITLKFFCKNDPAVIKLALEFAQKLDFCFSFVVYFYTVHLNYGTAGLAPAVPLISQFFKTRGVMIQVSDLTKSYGDRLAIDHLNFEARAGEIVGF